MSKAVVLLSGGLDSTTLLHYVRQDIAGEDICALAMVYGQRHVRELEMAEWQAGAAGVGEYREVDISFLADMLAGSSSLVDESIDVPELSEIEAEDLEQPVTYVPNRNMILLSLAAARAEAWGADRVFYGAQAQDRYGYWDCTVDFVDKINDVLRLNRKNAVEIVAPFAELSKAELLRIGLDLGVDYGRTWSCYRGGAMPCGVCPTCVERSAAFAEVGVRDPLEGFGGDL
jgi:7-cyano-7-deazaguanine synthase